MLAWLLYLTVVCGTLGLAGLLFERTARAHHRATRWIWVGTMLGSILVPFIVSMVSRDFPSRHHNQQSAQPTSEVDWRQFSRAPQIDLGSVDADWKGGGEEFDRVIRAVWLISSIATGSFLLVGCLRIQSLRRRWRSNVFESIPVWVAPDMGPAVVGIVRPRIVVPESLFRYPLDVQRLVVAHEYAHARSFDASLSALAFGVLVLMPWNLVLWWQARRLRLAIEVDCDRRVLRAGYDIRQYVETLVDFGIQRNKPMGAVVAMSEAASSLERRIALMNSPKLTRLTHVTVAFVTLALGSATAATQFEPPKATLLATATLDQPVKFGLEQFVGSYEFATVTVLEIHRAGGKLSVQFPGASPDSLERAGTDSFRYMGIDASITFSRDPDGQVNGLTFHQNGADTLAPRIGGDRVREINNQLAEHVKNHTPYPGSEAALRRLVEGILTGKPNYAEMSAQLAGGTRAMLANFQATFQSMGVIRSIAFKGISPTGWDLFGVQHEHGSASWQIALDSKGIIVGALVHSDT
jgi:bla regulator protein BlaR1